MAQKDFIKRAEEFAAEQWDVEDKRLYQTRHDYLAGCEYTFQYTIDKIEKWLAEHAKEYVCMICGDGITSVTYEDKNLINDLRKAMKE